MDRMRAGIAELDAEYTRRFPAPPAGYTVEDIEVDDDDSDIQF